MSSEGVLLKNDTHYCKNTVAKGFNQTAPPARTITVALDMRKAFDTIKIHSLIRNLLQTNIPGTIIKFIKGCKVYTTYRNHTSRHQFKTGVSQGGILSSTLFNIYTSDLPPLSAHVQVMAYTDDITITSTSMSAANKYIQPYLHKVFAWTNQNNRGCTQDTNIQHLHDEALILPIHEYLLLHASQYKQKRQHPSHPLHKPTTYFNTPTTTGSDSSGNTERSGRQQLIYIKCYIYLIVRYYTNQMVMMSAK